MSKRILVQSEAAAAEAALAAYDDRARWVLEAMYMLYPAEEYTVQNQRNRWKELTSMIKEALTGDEDEKEKLEELETEFEKLTEWLKEVRGDRLQKYVDVQRVDGHWRRKPSSNHRPS